MIKQGGAGSILNETDPVRINALQRVAIEESRLSIPLLMARDVIHGFKTIFPIPLGQAASFNPQVAEDGARVAAIEASSVGIRWTFAPMIDIARDPRWGRGQETYGEDPYLTSKIGKAFVLGLQGDDPRYLKASACAKHYAVHSGPEKNRHSFNSDVSTYDLWDTYLPAFRTLVVDANVSGVMCAYNACLLYTSPSPRD